MQFSKIITLALAGLAASSPVKPDLATSSPVKRDLAIGVTIDVVVSDVVTLAGQVAGFTGGLLDTLAVGTGIALLPVEIVTITTAVELLAVLGLAESAQLIADIKVFANQTATLCGNLVAKTTVIATAGLTLTVHNALVAILSVVSHLFAALQVILIAAETGTLLNIQASLSASLNAAILVI